MVADNVGGDFNTETNRIEFEDGSSLNVNGVTGTVEIRNSDGSMTDRVSILDRPVGS